eukprot:TRINITY_DN7707_c0_g1_i11.p1 TRINITY_DN7707_c0_g1~~TRINITY_DN7707_c0_g1_i11.p1  ORF type:complete len:251 (-),score=63.85 TRINITY_DN7707_c0_g1_i11:225-977(-)
MTWNEIREFAIKEKYLMEDFKAWHIRSSIKADLRRTTKPMEQPLFMISSDGSGCTLTEWGKKLVHVIKEDGKLEILISLLKSKDFGTIDHWRKLYLNLETTRTKKRNSSSKKRPKKTNTSPPASTARQFAIREFSKNNSPRESSTGQSKRPKVKSAVDLDLLRTILIDGVPRCWGEDTTRKRLLRIFSNQFKLTPISVQKNFQDDLWLLTLSSHQEAQKLVGSEFKIPASAKGSGSEVLLKIVGLGDSWT